MKCLCGTIFSLESYHDTRPERMTTCHTCYRDVLPMFTKVVLDQPLRGFRPTDLMLGDALQGDVLMVLDYDFQTRVYTLTAGSLIFRAKASTFHAVGEGAAKYMKDVYPVRSAGEIMLENIQNELKELEKTPEIKALLEE